MPVQRNKDSKGPFYRWGDSTTTHRYRYKAGNERSRKLAHAKAARQGRAIKMRQNR